MIRFSLVTSLALLVHVGAIEPFTLQMKVGGEYAIRCVIEPAVTQIGEDGEPLASTMPQPPYTWQFKYDRTLVKYLRASDGVTVAVTNVPSTNYAVARCETSLTDAYVYWKAMKATETAIKAPVQNATANGEVLTVVNEDSLKIDPRKAVLRVNIEAIELE